MTDDALTLLRHRHNARTAGGWWTERDRDIASLLACVDELTASLARARGERDALQSRLILHDDWIGALGGENRILSAERDRLAAFREAHYRRVYGE